MSSQTKSSVTWHSDVLKPADRDLEDETRKVIQGQEKSEF